MSSMARTFASAVIPTFCHVDRCHPRAVRDVGVLFGTLCRVCCTKDGAPRAPFRARGLRAPATLSRTRADSSDTDSADTPRTKISERFLGWSRSRRRAKSHQRQWQRRRRRRRDGFTNNDENCGSGGATTMPYASCHLQCSAAGSARTSRDRQSRLVIGATLARGASYYAHPWGPRSIHYHRSTVASVLLPSHSLAL